MQDRAGGKRWLPRSAAQRSHAARRARRRLAAAAAAPAAPQLARSRAPPHIGSTPGAPVGIPTRRPPKFQTRRVVTFLVTPVFCAILETRSALLSVGTTGFASASAAWCGGEVAREGVSQAQGSRRVRSSRRCKWNGGAGGVRAPSPCSAGARRPRASRRALRRATRAPPPACTAPRGRAAASSRPNASCARPSLFQLR